MLEPCRRIFRCPTAAREYAAPEAITTTQATSAPTKPCAVSSRHAALRCAQVILFDGVCNFCNRWVGFVLDNDPDGLFAFASLQSDAGGELLAQCGRDSSDLSTFVMIDDSGQFYTQSDAALRVAATLEKPALNALSTAFTPLPTTLRDGVYRLVANNRYSFLGKDESGGPESCKLRADAAVVADRFLG